MDEKEKKTGILLGTLGCYMYPIVKLRAHADLPVHRICPQPVGHFLQHLKAFGCEPTTTHEEVEKIRKKDLDFFIRQTHLGDGFECRRDE